MKKVISLILIAVLALSFSACGPGTSSEEPAEDQVSEQPAVQEESMTLKIAHIRPQGSVADEDIHAFAADVEQRTNGTVKFEIYPASQLGDYTTVLERVSIGDVDMQIAPIGTNLDKSFGIAVFPYLVQNWDKAKEVYASGSELNKHMEEVCEQNDIKILGTYPLYFGGIALTKKPSDPTGLGAKDGIKIRVPSMKAFELTAQELGYLVTPLPAADTFTSIQTGIVEGAIGLGAEGYYSSYRDVIKYYLPINDHFEMWYICLSTQTWDKMSQAQQEAISAAAKDMETKRFADAEAQQKDYEDQLAAEGIEVITFTDEQIGAYTKAVQENVWPAVKPDIGEEFFDSIVEKYNLMVE